MIESQAAASLDPVEPGHRVRRGLWVALGFTAAIAAYFAYAAHENREWRHHRHDKWTEARHTCTPTTVAYRALSPEYDRDTEILCYAAGGRLDKVRELIDPLAKDERENVVGPLLYATHVPGHRGDPMAQAVLAEYGDTWSWSSHRGFVAYHAGNDLAAIPILEQARAQLCNSPWSSSPRGCDEVIHAEHDIGVGTPLAERTARCPDEADEDVREVGEWLTCMSYPDSCEFDDDAPPLPHPWFAARAGCTAAGRNDGIEGMRRVDEPLCLAAAGKLDALRTWLATDTQREISQNRIADAVQLFLQSDARARDVLDFLAAQHWTQRWDRMRIARYEMSICHDAEARALLESIEYVGPQHGNQSDGDFGEAQRRLAELAKPHSCR